MKIVIEIDEETYNDIKLGKIYSSYRDVPQESVVAIANGTPLQKEHGDAVSRQAAINIVKDMRGLARADVLSDAVKQLKDLPSVTPQPEVGRWIYDKNIDNWKCSKCGETPKTMGYCGSVAFMAEHFKYCNHCGSKMQEVEE